MMTDCGNTECPTHGIGIAMNGHGLAFEKPIEVYLHLTIDGEQRAVFVGRAYQNPHGYFAQTDAGIMPATGIEDALSLINENIDMEGRGLRRIDPPAAVVQMDDPCTTFIAETSEDPCETCGVGVHQHGGAFAIIRSERSDLKGLPSKVPMDEDKTKRVYDAAHSEEPDMDLWISFIIGKEGKG